jgi:peptidoglycan hydrolase-like protein with peptidoglycan-binding domain
VPRAATIDAADAEEGGLRALLSRALGRNPVDVIGLFVLLMAVGAILANALYRQPGPHPAPIFSIKPRPVADRTDSVTPIPRARPAAAKSDAAARPRPDLIADIQRELSKRGLFEGGADGVMGPKTDAAIRDFETLANLKVTGEPSDELLRALQRGPKLDGAAPRAGARDQIGEKILNGSAPALATAQRVVAVQRALNDSGYGPVKATGTIGPETTAAIRKFEGDRKMPVTGQISVRLVRELAAFTGRPLE